MDTYPQFLILYDGQCHLCNGIVNRLIRLDVQAKFRYVPIQSSAGQYLIRNYAIDIRKIDSIILLENSRIYIKSTAVLRICRHLPRWYPMLYIAVGIPVCLRHAIYDWIARHRYRWFGKSESCILPTPEIQARFILDKHDLHANSLK